MSLKLALLVLCFSATAYLVVMFRAGLGSPEKRRWPPQNVTRWSLLEIWGGSSIVFLCAYVLGALDADHVEAPVWVRYGVGLPLFVLGSGVVSLGMYQLGLGRTSGADGGVETSGLYRLVRHPQYWGHGAALTGWVLYTASLWSIPAVCAAFLALFWAVRAEEDWLALRAGDPSAQSDPRIKGAL